jgi:hypothetical protein
MAKDAKDPKSPERQAVEAMYTAIGALKMSDAKCAQDVVEQLQKAIDRFDPRCEHDFSDGALSPRGGYQATCKKCRTTIYSQ